MIFRSFLVRYMEFTDTAELEAHVDAEFAHRFQWLLASDMVCFSSVNFHQLINQNSFYKSLQTDRLRARTSQPIRVQPEPLIPEFTPAPRFLRPILPQQPLMGGPPRPLPPQFRGPPLMGNAPRLVRPPLVAAPHQRYVKPAMLILCTAQLPI